MFEPEVALFSKNPTLMCCIENFDITKTCLVCIYKLHLDQFAKIIIMFRVGTPYPIFFENVTQHCMVDRPTLSILGHDI